MSDVYAVEPRQFRNFNTQGVVLALARCGVAIATIARALVINESQVTDICKSGIRKDKLAVMPPAHNDVRQQYLAEVINLRAENELLQEHLRALAEKRDGSWLDVVGFAGLSVYEAKLVAALLVNDRLPKDRLYFVMYGDVVEHEMPDPKVVDVFVCKTRKKLKPLGIDIITVWGVGYEFRPEHRERLLALIAAARGKLPSQLKLAEAA